MEAVMTAPTPLSRRQVFAGAAALVSACASSGKASDAAAPAFCPEAARKGRLKQSLTDWPYVKHFGGLDGLCKTAKDLGCVSVELCKPKDWPTLQKHGLVCAIAGSHGYVQGFNDPANHAVCVAKIKEAADAGAATGCSPSVITFTGFRGEIPDDVGAKNTVAGLKKVIGYCEEKKINLVIEMLNSRVAEETKGHPGYQGDHMDYVIDIVKQLIVSQRGRGPQPNNKPRKTPRTIKPRRSRRPRRPRRPRRKQQHMRLAQDHQGLRRFSTERIYGGHLVGPGKWLSASPRGHFPGRLQMSDIGHAHVICRASFTE
jgi:hypothetical protein